MAKYRVDDVDHDYRRPRGRAGADVEHDDIDDIDESLWDDVVDVVCVGRGRLGEAVAAAARRVGLEVLVSDRPDTATSDAEHLDGLLGVTDEQTVAYLRALTEDFGPLAETHSGIPTRVVGEPLRPAARRARLETFYGAALRDWGTACVSSPYGLLYTRVVDPILSVPYAGTGGSIAATVLDSIDLDPELPEDSVEHWLSATAQGDQAATADTFTRLLFDDAVVVGAVLKSPDGERTVRARHGVMLPLRDGVSASAHSAGLNLRETAEVALVSRTASRFARLEFLVRESP